MNILVNSLSLCPGGNHIIFDLSVDGKNEILSTTFDDILVNEIFDLNPKKMRIRSFCLENNISKNFNGLKNLIEGMLFKI